MPLLPGGVVCPIVSFDQVYDWTCQLSEDCQDVYDIPFQGGASVTFAATEVTDGSVLRIALYAPGVALGGTNLFTGTANELLCNYVAGCGSNTAGQTVSDFTIPITGTYRFAVTRDWGTSCGFSGTYRMMITSDKAFLGVTSTGDNIVSQAPGEECPIP